MKAKISTGKPIAKVNKPRIPIPPVRKAQKKISSLSKKKQSVKLLKIPALKAVKKYVKKQAKSSLIPSVLKQFKKPIRHSEPVRRRISTSKRSLPAGRQGFVTKSVPQDDILQQSSQKSIFIDDTNIPTSYEKTWIALIVKDPHWVYATWEISQNSLQPFLSQLDDPQYPSRIVLRVYDVTCLEFNGANANYYFDHEVGRSTNNWHINLWTDHASYCAEIGLKALDGTFTPLARSNFVQTPRAGHSWRTEQIWMEVKDNENESPYMVVRIPHRGQSARGGAKTIRRKFYLTDEDIRSYYARLMPFLRNILSSRLGKRGRLEGNDWDRDEIYRLSGEEFLEEITAGASEILIRQGKRKMLGASEHLSSHFTI